MVRRGLLCLGFAALVAGCGADGAPTRPEPQKTTRSSQTGFTVTLSGHADIGASSGNQDEVAKASKPWRIVP